MNSIENVRRYEFIKDQYLTRETSTLTVTTLTTSFSVTFLIIFYSQVLFQKPFNFEVGLLVCLSALFFTLIGVFYREITVFGVNLHDFKTIRKFYLLPNYRRDILFLRSFILRVFFYFPLGLWVSILVKIYFFISIYAATLVSVLLFVVIPAILVGVEHSMYGKT